MVSCAPILAKDACVSRDLLALLILSVTAVNLLVAVKSPLSARPGREGLVLMRHSVAASFDCCSLSRWFLSRRHYHLHWTHERVWSCRLLRICASASVVNTWPSREAFLLYSGREWSLEADQFSSLECTLVLMTCVDRDQSTMNLNIQKRRWTCVECEEPQK